MIIYPAVLDIPPCFCGEVFNRDGVAKIFAREPLKASPTLPVTTPLTPHTCSILLKGLRQPATARASRTAASGDAWRARAAGFSWWTWRLLSTFRMRSEVGVRGGAGHEVDLPPLRDIKAGRWIRLRGRRNQDETRRTSPGMFAWGRRCRKRLWGDPLGNIDSK
jgi:hypothetical protein